MINSAYYSVPFQLIGETVDVCMTYSLVRIFHKHREIALHEKATKKWEYKRKAEHAPPFQEAVLQCSRDGLLALASDIGTFTHQVAYNILSHPLRSLEVEPRLKAVWKLVQYVRTKAWFARVANKLLVKLI